MMEMAATQEKQAASSGKNKKSVNDRFEFRWVDRPAEQFSPPRSRSRHRGYADPTADAAIGNIMREEKRRKRAKARKRKRTGNTKGYRSSNREDKDAGSGS